MLCRMEGTCEDVEFQTFPSKILKSDRTDSIKQLSTQPEENDCKALQSCIYNIICHLSQWGKITAIAVLRIEYGKLDLQYPKK